MPAIGLGDQGGETGRTGRLDGEIEMLVEQRHGGADGIVIDQHDVVDDGADAGDGVGDRHAHRDAVSDRIDRGPVLLLVQDCLRHRRRPGRRDGDDPDSGRCLGQPGADPRHQRPVAERQQDMVERVGIARQLDADRAGALGDRGLCAVFHVYLAQAPRMGGREFLGGVEIMPGEPDVGAKRVHRRDLAGGCVDGGKDGDRNAASPRRPGKPLAEIAGRSAHQMLIVVEPRDKGAGAAALEGADRVGCLVLELDLGADRTVERGGPAHRGVAEDRVDRIERGGDSGGGWVSHGR